MTRSTWLPTARLTTLLGLVLMASVGLLIAEHAGAGVQALPWVAGILAAIGLAAVVDAIAHPRRVWLSGERQVPEAMAVGAASDIHVRLTNQGGRRCRAVLFDHYPGVAHVDAMPMPVVLTPGEALQLKYPITFTDRGRHTFGPVELRLLGPLGLIARDVCVGGPSEVKVYPNFVSVARYALFALDNRLSQLGVKQKRRRGEGLDFHQLRDYREGDAIRQIDWKAAARTQRLISREYQDERDQRIVFLLDTSGRMRSRDGDISHFDQALNAMLLLSYVALRQGDAVGLMAFGRVPRYLEPSKGNTVLGAMMNTVFDVHATPGAPDYLEAAEKLLGKVRKRALVVLLTNLRDEDANEIIPAVELLQSRHLVLVASLREAVVGDLLTQPIQGLASALDVAAARLYLGERYKAFQSLTTRGVFTLDVTPKELPISLVNRYLDVKRSGRL